MERYDHDKSMLSIESMDSKIKAVLDIMNPDFIAEPKQKNILSKVEEALQLSEHFMRDAAEKSNTWTNKDVPGSKRLIFRNDMVAKCFNDLIVILEFIDIEIFNYHVNSEKNDIADWIGNVYQRKELSHKLRSIQNKEDMIMILKKIA